MGAVGFAIVGKENSRLFFSVSDKEKVREYDVQLFVHCSLDIVDEKVTRATELFLGQLYTDQRYKSFGFMSNTGVKFILVVDLNNTSFKDQELRAVFKRFHQNYCNAISNPFYQFGEPIDSKFLRDCAQQLFAQD